MKLKNYKARLKNLLKNNQFRIKQKLIKKNKQNLMRNFYKKENKKKNLINKII